MADTGYDLLNEPWVRVRDDEGVREVSLREAFEQAHDLTALAGEVPTQDAAILRLMLAVLHRVVADAPDDPVDVWRDLWESPTLPMGRVDDYLDTVADRFDLFDPVAPFMQVAGLTAGKTSGLGKLIADLPDGHAYFTMRAGRGLASVSVSEAARWLVHCQAYDPSGIKTGVAGDPRVKGGKGYPIGTGWAGRCGLVIFEGDSLKETLLLNLVVDPSEADSEPDLPVWERPPLGPGVEKRHPEPLGPADIMTWPSRRVLLHRDPDRPDQVVDALLGIGDRLELPNRQGLEQMSAFRYSPTQSRKLNQTVYMPRPHDPNRALWRGLAGILVHSPAGGAVRDTAEPDLPPRTVEWLARLSGDVLDPGRAVRLRAVGMSYGTQDASVETTYDDALTLRVAVTGDAELRSVAIEGASGADAAVWKGVGHLAENLAAAAGRAVEGPREAARMDGYDRLGAAYAEWLASLAPGVDAEAALTAWHRRVERILVELGEALVDGAGQAAWVGRDVRGRHVDSSVAWAWFRASLRATLPNAHAASMTEPTPEIALTTKEQS